MDSVNWEKKGTCFNRNILISLPNDVIFDLSKLHTFVGNKFDEVKIMGFLSLISTGNKEGKAVNIAMFEKPYFLGLLT